MSKKINHILLELVFIIVALLLRVYNINAKADGTDEKWSFIMTDQIVDGTFLQNLIIRAKLGLLK